MWDVGRGKDSAHMRDHCDDAHDDHVDDDDDRFERRLGSSLCVAMREIATFFASPFCALPLMISFVGVSLHFTSSCR